MIRQADLCRPQWRPALGYHLFRPAAQERLSMHAERYTRKRFWLASWLFVLSAISYLDRTNVSIAGLQISSEYGLGNQRLGWIFSAFLIGYAGFQVPAGWLASRFGPRRVISLGVVWWGIATALTTMIPVGISQAVLLLIAIRFALGAGEAVIYPAANQLVARWVPEQERGFINGLIFAGVGAGSGLTPPLLAWFILHYGWRSAFWFSAVVGVLAGGAGCGGGGHGILRRRIPPSHRRNCRSFAGVLSMPLRPRPPGLLRLPGEQS